MHLHSQVVKINILNRLRKLWHYILFQTISKIYLCKSHFPCANSSSCSCLPVTYIACRLNSVCKPIPKTITLCFYFFSKKVLNYNVQITLFMCQFQLMFLPPSSLFCSANLFCLQDAYYCSVCLFSGGLSSSQRLSIP